MSVFRIVPEASEVAIDARSSVHPIRGKATELQGRVEVGDTISGRIEVPVAGLRSGNPLEDAELHRRVDARTHPVIVGEIRRAEAVGGGVHRVEGDVTFHGVTRPVTGDLAVSAENGRLVLEGEHVFDVREFGIEPPRILMLKVHPDVTVRIRLVAEPE